MPTPEPSERRGERLTREQYALPAAELAPRLLGCLLVRRHRGERLSGVIVEVEAYTGVEDRASHAFGGRRTPRNESMYAEPGVGYVYFTYGMHHCVNVVCEAVDRPAAVLIRAIEPVDGLETMRRHRGGVRTLDLCNGPAKLCQALAIDRALDRTDLVTGDDLWLEAGPGVSGRVMAAARVGIGDKGAWTRRRLRWLVAGHPHVSVKPT
jgi:DNA-3-methyladenine glycosylase